MLIGWQVRTSFGGIIDLLAHVQSDSQESKYSASLDKQAVFRQFSRNP